MKAWGAALVIAAGIVALAVPVVWVTFLVAKAFSKGFTLAEMDWNRDGRTTFSEIMEAVDVGERQSIDHPRCREYFSLKDGLPLRIICPAGYEPESEEWQDLIVTRPE